MGKPFKPQGPAADGDASVDEKIRGTSRTEQHVCEGKHLIKPKS